MDYVLKASVIIILFYTCYKLFLQRETYFQQNRWFLLIGLFIAAFLPLVVIPIYIEYSPALITLYETSNVVPEQIQVDSSIDLWEILINVYIVGCTFFFGKVILHFLSLIKLLNSQKKINKKPFVFIETEQNISPFSFFNFIVINTKQFNTEELEYVIVHEQTHAKQLHSLDIILINIATIFFWFNPFIWWYKKAVQQNLEFIADSEAQKTVDCAKSYQTILLKASLSVKQLYLPTNFYQSLIKKRIVMLQKSKSKNHSYIKLAIVLPFLALFLMSFNLEKIYIPKSETTQNKVNKEGFAISSKSSDKDRLDAEIDNFKNLLDNNRLVLENYNGEKSSNYRLKATDTIEQKSKSGVNENAEQPIYFLNGKIVSSEIALNLDPDKIATINVLKGKAAIEKYGKKGENGVVEMSLKNTNAQNQLTLKDNSNYLYILDGMEISKSEVLNLLSKETISVLNFLPAKVASEKYGEEGINGVIEVTLKNINDKESESNFEIVGFGTSTITGIYDESGSEDTTKKDPNSILKDLNLNDEGNNQALIILDGAEINYNLLSAINPKEIISINILKDNAAVKIYGNKAKNGAIEIFSTKNPFIVEYDSSKLDSKFVEDSLETESNSPWKFNYGISSVTFIDDKDPPKNLSILHISENTPDVVLDTHKEFLKTQGVDLRYATIKRNKNGELIKIKISVEDKNGNKSKVTYQSNKGIKPIKITLDDSGDVIISSE